MEGWKQKLKLRVPALILLAATVLFWSAYDRYEPVGPALLTEAGLSDGVNIRGEVAESGGRFTLHVPDGGKPSRIDFSLPAAVLEHGYIRVQGRIKADGVVAGRHSWNCARMLLVQYDENRKWIPGNHGLAAERGSRDWVTHEDVFELFPQTAYVAVVLQQSGIAGTVCFEQIRAQSVRLRPSFIWWRSWFAASWLFMAMAYFKFCRLHHRRLRILILLNIVAILAGTLMPGEWIQSGTKKAKAGVRALLPDKPAPPDESPTQKSDPKPPALQKQMDWFLEMEVRSHQAGHFLLFASLCFLIYLSAALEHQRPVYFIKVGADMLLFAAITESLQYLTLDRSAGVGDLRIDLYGMGVAMVLFVMVLPLVRRGRAKPA